jgi:hypothetical protein
MAAELEMSLSNFRDAQKILFLGARAVTQWSNATFGDNKGLSHLLHDWAICEWNLGHLDRAGELFDHALRLVGETGSPLRAFIMYSIARLKQYMGELHLAQHCVGLALKENSFPGGNAKVWALWAEIAEEMGNMKLKEDCLEQSVTCKENISQDGEISRLLTVRTSSSGNASSSVSGENRLVRRDPWKVKLFGNQVESLNAFKSVKFPSKKVRRLAKQEVA